MNPTASRRGRKAVYPWATLLKKDDSCFVVSPKKGVASAAFAWGKRRGFSVSTSVVEQNGQVGLRVQRIS